MDVVVSSDSVDTGLFAREQGCAFRARDKPLCLDSTPMVDVLLDVLESRVNTYDTVVMLYPCAPLAEKGDILKGLHLVHDFAHKVAVPVYRSREAPERALIVHGDTVTPRYPEYKDTNSNGFTPTYYSAGQWYVADVSHLLLSRTLTPLEAGYVEIPATRAIDIDTKDDWDLAELMYDRLHGQQKQVDANE